MRTVSHSAYTGGKRIRLQDKSTRAYSSSLRIMRPPEVLQEEASEDSELYASGDPPLSEVYRPMHRTYGLENEVGSSDCDARTDPIACDEMPGRGRVRA